MSVQNPTKRLTICAMLCALGVVILWLGSVIEVIDLSMAVIASLLCVIAVIEYGGGAPWLIFAVTSILSFVLLPNKGIVAIYAFFFGYYPILKEKLEMRGRVLSWVCKEVIYHLALVAILLSWRFLFFTEDLALPSTPILWVAVFAALEVVFILYDVALTRLISFYIFRLRRRLPFFRK